MERKRLTPVTTAGCFAAVMLILALLSTYIPFFSFVGYFIMPIPMTIIYMKYGLRQAIMLGVTASLLMGIFIDPVTAVVQFIVFASVGIALGMGFQREWSPARLLLGVTIALIGASVVLMAVLYAVMDINLLASLNEAFTVVMDSTIEQYRSSGMSDIQLAETKAQLDQIRQLLPTILPMIICFSMAIIGYINVKISQLVLCRLGFEVKPFLPIRYWEIPRSMIYLYILALVMKYWGTTRDIEWLSSIGINLNQIAFFFIAIQGLAFLFYFLHKRFKIGTWIQGICIAMFFLIPGITYLAFIVGIVDMLLNYRKKQIST